MFRVTSSNQMVLLVVSIVLPNITCVLVFDVTEDVKVSISVLAF